jgi:hypothetical protein
MKKSSIVTIGLLAVSLAACHKRSHRYPARSDWSSDNAYVSDGSGNYYRGNPMFPFWMWYYMGYMNGRTYYSSGAHYYGAVSGIRSTYTGRGFVTSGGESYSVSRGFVSRGGFGESGHAGGVGE